MPVGIGYQASRNKKKSPLQGQLSSAIEEEMRRIIEGKESSKPQISGGLDEPFQQHLDYLGAKDRGRGDDLDRIKDLTSLGGIFGDGSSNVAQPSGGAAAGMRQARGKPTTTTRLGKPTGLSQMDVIKGMTAAAAPEPFDSAATLSGSRPGQQPTFMPVGSGGPGFDPETPGSPEEPFDEEKDTAEFLKQQSAESVERDRQIKAAFPGIEMERFKMASQQGFEQGALSSPEDSGGLTDDDYRDPGSMTLEKLEEVRRRAAARAARFGR